MISTVSPGLIEPAAETSPIVVTVGKSVVSSPSPSPSPSPSASPSPSPSPSSASASVSVSASASVSVVPVGSVLSILSQPEIKVMEKSNTIATNILENNSISINLLKIMGE